eukprot:scaffold16904_cov72-Phaeocystis_antarctica.AAC.2
MRPSSLSPTSKPSRFKVVGQKHQPSRGNGNGGSSARPTFQRDDTPYGSSGCERRSVSEPPRRRTSCRKPCESAAHMERRCRR